MSIKTDEFTSTLMRAFVEKAANSVLYLFGSDFSNSENATDTNYSKNYFLEHTIFGMKLTSDDVSFMFREIVWQTGIFYDMYDSEDILSDKDYYVIVEPEEDESGDYHVFKCLFNNNGGASSFAPYYNEAILENNGEIHLADGYIWKYMFTVPYLTVKKFRTRSYFPITINEEVANTAVDGLSVIQVENFADNTGYEKITGEIKFAPDDSGTVILDPNENEYFEVTNNFYRDRILYVTKSSNGEEIGAAKYVITGSGSSGSDHFVTIESYNSGVFEIDPEDDFQILPQVIIKGTGTGAEAIPVFNTDGTTINFIKILDRGSGYKAADAYIVDPVSFNTSAGDVRAILRPIIPPKNGHGSDSLEELRSNGVGISAGITSFATDIPDSGGYSELGLVLEPTITGSPNTFDNRLKIELASVANMEVGDVVSQSSGVTGIIHEIGEDFIYVVDYNGAYNITFSDSLPLIFNSVNINITDITESPYTQRTGDPIYISDFDTIQRSADKTETVKILIDF